MRNNGSSLERPETVHNSRSPNKDDQCHLASWSRRFPNLDRHKPTLDALPPKLREIVDLRYTEGLSFRQIASQLGISRNGAFTRHTRAIASLRDAFDAPREA